MRIRWRQTARKNKVKNSRGKRWVYAGGSEAYNIMKDRMKTSDAKCLLEDLGMIQFVLAGTAPAALKSLMSALKNRLTCKQTCTPELAVSHPHKQLTHTRLVLTHLINYCMHAPSTDTQAWEL